MAANILYAQDRLGRSLLIENPSAYLAFRHSPIPEPEFLTELAQRTGCAILLDINNLYVSACNLGFDAEAALCAYPDEMVGEIHLAGHAVKQIGGTELRIDDHSCPVQEPVWRLFERVLERIGSRPTLIEWDSDIPPLEVLVGQAELADQHLARAAKVAGA